MSAFEDTVDQAQETAKGVARAADEALNEFGKSIADGGRAVENAISDNLTPDKVSEGLGNAFDAIGNSINDAANAAADGVTTGYILDDSNQWGWITLYVVTIVIAVLGNLLFIVASLCTKRTRTTGYYLLINLSIRDILLACLCIPFTLDYEIIHYTWNFGSIYCIVYRFAYYCFLFFLPLTILFLAFHLFVENCKWNFAGEEGVVPRPWPHTIFLPLIWFFSALFAVPTVFFSEVRKNETDDFYRNEIVARPGNAQVCMHAGGDWLDGSNFFFISSNLLTFSIPFVLLFIPWWALLVQVFGCCTRKLRSSEFWLSLITLFLVLIYEASRAPFELFNIHHILTNWANLGPLEPFIPNIDAEPYVAVMKWAVYAPALLHPLLYFTFSPEARHGVYILFSRMCSCCCSKSDRDVEVASDDEKGRMLAKGGNDEAPGNNGGQMDTHDGAPLHPTQEQEM